MSNNTIGARDLFPHVENFYKLEGQEKTYAFLSDLGLFLQQAILEVNELVELSYMVVKMHGFWVLILNWDSDVDLGDQKHEITIRTSDIDNANKFILSFLVIERESDRISSEEARGGFPLGVLENNIDVYNAFIDFLLSGKMPDLKIFEQKVIHSGQQSIFG